MLDMGDKGREEKRRSSRSQKGIYLLASGTRGLKKRPGTRLTRVMEKTRRPKKEVWISSESRGSRKWSGEIMDSRGGNSNYLSSTPICPSWINLERKQEKDLKSTLQQFKTSEKKTEEEERR